MKCCDEQKTLRPRRGWWQSASGFVGSGALLVLLAKCPMCVAAYLALWMGASAAMPVATHLRVALEMVFGLCAMVLVARAAMVRRRRGPA